MESCLLCQMPALEAVLKGSRRCHIPHGLGWDVGHTFSPYPSCCLTPLMQSTEMAKAASR